MTLEFDTRERVRMNDWLDELTNGIKQADDCERREEDNRKYILHRADVLKTCGPELWEQFIESCQQHVTELNQTIGVTFPQDKSKEVELLRESPLGLILSGKTPPFSLNISYRPDRHAIVISGSRHIGNAIEGRDGLLLMELDSNGDAGLTNAERRQITVKSAARYLLRLGLATARPIPPS